MDVRVASRKEKRGRVGQKARTAEVAPFNWTT